MLYPNFVTEMVAFSRMPFYYEVEDVAREFQAVVALHDVLYYDPKELKKRGVEFLHAPIPDFSAPSLEQLIEIVKWINQRVREDKRVLIHCLGGSGRSGTTATAYLMTQGLSLSEALAKVRSLKPTAVETEEQLQILKEFEKMLKDCRGEQF